MELSCGIFMNGECYKEIDIENLKGKHRVVLGDREKHKNPAKLITSFLSGVLAYIEGFELNSDPKKAEEQKKTALRRMANSDRDLIIMELKLRTKKNIMESEHFCPFCRTINYDETDLNKVEIKKIQDAKLVNGNPVVEFYDEEIKYVARIPLGEDGENIAPIAKKNPVLGSHKLFQTLLVSIDDNTDIPLDFMAETDVDKLDRLIEKWQEELPGPQLTKTIECYDCGRKFLSPVDFSDFLFGGGSLNK